MKIQEADSAKLTQLWSGVETRVEQAACAEEAAQAFASAVYGSFSDSVVLMRVFLTVPFARLPKSNQDFVRNLAQSAGGASDLKETTPVLSLLGSCGQEPDWNDRRKSKGHMGIPLISSSFVGEIPMISRLLRELGVPIDWIDSHDSGIIKKAVSDSSGLFFVDDATTAKDHEGRNIIAAQDFVSGYNVKSVFGAGEAYENGQMMVFVLFCRDTCSREVAERYALLANSFKGHTSSQVEAGKIFSA